MSEKLVPTEADREAAALLYEWFPMISSSREEAAKTAAFIRAGGGDGWNTVQAFAQHAAAARAEERERFDEIDLYRIIKRSGAKKRIDIARAVLAAIRAGAGE